MVAIPYHSTYDMTTNSYGNLTIGQAPNTRYQGNEKEGQAALDLGVTTRIGRGLHKENKRSIHVGLYSQWKAMTERWRSTSTDLITGITNARSGSRTIWSYALAPGLGFRMNNGRGLWVAELRGVVQWNVFPEPSGPSTMAMATLAYCWRIRE